MLVKYYFNFKLKYTTITMKLTITKYPFVNGIPILIVESVEKTGLVHTFMRYTAFLRKVNIAKIGV
jgi:hypothetical protein